MASIIRHWRFGVPAGQCWDAVRDFGALHERLASERLVGIDDEAMRLVYTVVSGALGSTHYNASVQVVPDGEQACTFVWIIDVLPDELADRVAALMHAGLTAIRTTVEGSTTRPADSITGS